MHDLPFGVGVTPSTQKPSDLPGAPFVAEHLRHTSSSTSYFTPQARLVIDTAALRQGGLLAALTDESSRTLLSVLCFLTANGRAEPTAHQVASVLGTSTGKARDRLLRLSAVRFGDEPVLRVHRTESGLEMFGISPHVLTSRDEEPEAGADAPAAMPSHRAAITEHSRAMHARPRAEVERMVLEQLGLPGPETFDESPEGELRKRLAAIGMARDTVTNLIGEFGVDAVGGQLDWLPYRNAKDPARYLAAAVRGQYAEPAQATRERLQRHDVIVEFASPDPMPTPKESIIYLRTPGDGDSQPVNEVP